MDIIYSKIATGKTTKLIKKSAEKGFTIVCVTIEEAKSVDKMACELGLKIPFPLTYKKFAEKNYNSCAVKNVLIDNADMWLQYIAGSTKIEMITLTEK